MALVQWFFTLWINKMHTHWSFLHPDVQIKRHTLVLYPKVFTEHSHLFLIIRKQSIKTGLPPAVFLISVRARWGLYEVKSLLLMFQRVIKCTRPPTVPMVYPWCKMNWFRLTVFEVPRLSKLNLVRNVFFLHFLEVTLSKNYFNLFLFLYVHKYMFIYPWVSVEATQWIWLA